MHTIVVRRFLGTSVEWTSIEVLFLLVNQALLSSLDLCWLKSVDLKHFNLVQIKSYFMEGQFDTCVKSFKDYLENDSAGGPQLSLKTVYAKQKSFSFFSRSTALYYHDISMRWNSSLFSSPQGWHLKWKNESPSRDDGWELLIHPTNEKKDQSKFQFDSTYLISYLKFYFWKADEDNAT